MNHKSGSQIINGKRAALIFEKEGALLHQRKQIEDMSFVF
jgi:hypothetical protein